MSSCELLIQHSELSLDSKVVDVLLSDQFVELPEAVSTGHNPQCSIASLSHIQVLLFQGKLSECLPVGLSRRCDVQGL